MTLQPLDLQELWLRMPWVDRDTGNWSLVRSVVIAVTFYFCHATEATHEFNWPGVILVTVCILAAMSKNVKDFRSGLTAIFRRRESGAYSSTEAATPRGGP